MPLVSILMLTHNAPEYVKKAVKSIKKHTKAVDYELVILDNASGEDTINTLKKIHKKGQIDTLALLSYNSLFAAGNNMAARLASPDSKYYLLLNSDIEIKDDNWLSNLLTKHHRGITAYGIVEDPLRVDGYCLLIDADLYNSSPLDEGHQWWWAVTKQQATLLQDSSVSVQGYREHEQWIHHFGGKSGSAYKNALGMNVTPEQVYGWFNGKVIHVIEPDK